MGEGGPSAAVDNPVCADTPQLVCTLKPLGHCRTLAPLKLPDQRFTRKPDTIPGPEDPHTTPGGPPVDHPSEETTTRDSN